MSTFPIAVDDQTVAHAWSDTMQLARAHNLSAYDASYLELTIRLGLPLAALDGKLKTAAQAMVCRCFISKHEALRRPPDGSTCVACPFDVPPRLGPKAPQGFHEVGW